MLISLVIASFQLLPFHLHAGFMHKDEFGVQAPFFEAKETCLKKEGEYSQLPFEKYSVLRCLTFCLPIQPAMHPLLKGKTE